MLPAPGATLQFAGVSTINQPPPTSALPQPLLTVRLKVSDATEAADPGVELGVGVGPPGVAVAVGGLGVAVAVGVGGTGVAVAVGAGVAGVAVAVGARPVP